MSTLIKTHLEQEVQNLDSLRELAKSKKSIYIPFRTEGGDIHYYFKVDFKDFFQNLHRLQAYDISIDDYPNSLYILDFKVGNR
jgi:hypothetical protein